MRRLFVLLVCLLLSALPILAIGCGDDEEEVLILYSGRSESLIAPAIEKFTQDTGIKVEVRYAGSVDLALTIIEEGQKSPADLFLSKSPGPVGLLGEKGHLAKLSKETLDLAPASAPWFPSDAGDVRRLINEIVLAEESDEAPDLGGDRRFISHFEMYVQAMEEVGADTSPIKTFLVDVKNEGVEEALLSQIIERAKTEGITKVKAEYIKTKKNKPTENFLSDFGFIKNGDVWIFETHKPIKKPEHLVIS